MAALSPDQIQQFERDGYLVVEHLLDPDDDIQPVLDEYAHVLDTLARELHERGCIRDTYAELPFDERLMRIYEESGSVYPQHFDFSLPQSGIEHDTPIWTGPAVFRMLRHPKLLDVIEALIGPEIYSNPVQHIRIKPPERRLPGGLEDGQLAMVGATPWHQDQGVINEEADESTIITVWFPLRDANEDNGCLAVVPRSHEAGLMPHCPAIADNRAGFGVHIKERLLDGRTVVPVPMQAGSVLLMTKQTIHSSLRNVSDIIRISFDLRYNPVGEPTGRSSFPGFVARSRRDPASELHDAETWSQSWAEARRALAAGEMPRFNRWDPNSPACA